LAGHVALGWASHLEGDCFASGPAACIAHAADRPVADDAVQPGDHVVGGRSLPAKLDEGFLDAVFRGIGPLLGVERQRSSVPIQ
jgi:hypothetical protein